MGEKNAGQMAATMIEMLESKDLSAPGGTNSNIILKSAEQITIPLQEGANEASWPAASRRTVYLTFMHRENSRKRAFIC